MCFLKRCLAFICFASPFLFVVTSAELKCESTGGSPTCHTSKSTPMSCFRFRGQYKSETEWENTNGTLVGCGEMCAAEGITGCLQVENDHYNGTAYCCAEEMCNGKPAECTDELTTPSHSTPVTTITTVTSTNGAFYLKLSPAALIVAVLKIWYTD